MSEYNPTLKLFKDIGPETCSRGRHQLQWSLECLRDCRKVGLRRIIASRQLENAISCRRISFFTAFRASFQW